jgi:hypothetical protein
VQAKFSQYARSGPDTDPRIQFNAFVEMHSAYERLVAAYKHKNRMKSGRMQKCAQISVLLSFSISIFLSICLSLSISLSPSISLPLCLSLSLTYPYPILSSDPSLASLSLQGRKRPGATELISHLIGAKDVYPTGEHAVDDYEDW